MISEHKSFSECKYPEIKDIFLATNYFGDETVTCRCIREKCVYSREWDYEYKEYYSRTLFGMNIALSMLGDIITDPPETSFPDELKQKIEKPLIFPTVPSEQ
ncbi:MAG: hypothetical protein U9N40_04285 [Euryarchaeota archaeon]|nr:hypothetical protein [Euryarchaeota archaeon]